MNGYSVERRDMYMDKELDEHLEKVYGQNSLDEYEEKLPIFLYIDSDGEVAIGVHGDSVVTEEWNEWLEKNGIEL